MIRSPLIASYIIGSFGRHEEDHLSDLDVLAIVKNRGGKVSETIIRDQIPSHIPPIKPSISWYGESRIRDMFKNGDLFAWHVFQDRIALYDPSDFLASVGTPAPYTEGVPDIVSFKKVLWGIPAQVSAHTANAIYEGGLIYVCLRNISMAASWSLCPKPDFSRYSAFRLINFEPCPISRDEFELLMQCRMAGQRGALPPPNVGPSFVLDVHKRILPWLDALEATVKRVTQNG